VLLFKTGARSGSDYHTWFIEAPNKKALTYGHRG
tara:strand:- start:80 stop:181 length:102 start_codon:yes stop_codon:yes gene_type:complete